MTNIAADIAAYRAMLLEAKAARAEQGVVDAKADAIAARVESGDLSDVARIAGLSTSSVALAAPAVGLAKLAGHHARTGRVTPVKLASDKQLAFIKTLAAERDRLSLVEADRVKIDYVLGGGVPTSKGASDLITTLLATAKAEKAHQAADAWSVVPAAKLREEKAAELELEVGVYLTPAGDTYRVYMGKQSGKLLAAKVIQDGKDYSFDYAGLASRFVKAGARKLTAEEAAAFGRLTECCIVCGIALDDPNSVKRGIGPVCAAKQGY